MGINRPGALSRVTLAYGRSPRTLRTYTTSFAAAENPLSEGGRWIHGATTGVDWKDMRSSVGLAYGTQDGSGGPPYNDSTAVLSPTFWGQWSADQEVEATVKSINQLGSAGNYQEVELRLRTGIIGHVLSGYEINFRCTHDGSQYHQIGRWFGPIGTAGCGLHCAFEACPNSLHPGDAENGMVVGDGLPGISDGDIIKASIVGNRIRTYINGVVMQDFTDDVFSTGQPGIGHWWKGAGAVNDFGLTSVTVREL